MTGTAATIADVLSKCAVAVEPVGAEQWAVTLVNGTAFAVRARLDDGWCCLEASLGGAAPARARAWECLSWNALLPGGARFALDPGAPRACVRAEVPLDEPVDVPARILAACTGLKAASGMLVHGPAPDAVAPEPVGGDLPTLCRETTWQVVEREPGRIAVELDVPGAPARAVVERRIDGLIAAAVPLFDAALAGAAPPAVCRQALGSLLLQTCGAVRLARAAVTSGDAPPTPRFEVVFGPRPCAAELAHAFAALSVAWRLAAREAAVLWTDETVATAYIHHQQQRQEGEEWHRQQQ